MLRVFFKYRFLIAAVFAQEESKYVALKNNNTNKYF